MKLLSLLLIPVVFSSCFTTGVTQKADADHRPQNVRTINKVFADSSRNIIVNFTAKLSGSKRNVPVHIVVPLQKVFAQYDTGLVFNNILNDLKNLPEVDLVRELKPNLRDSTARTLEIMLKQEGIRQGFYTPQDGNRLDSQQFRLPVRVGDYKWARLEDNKNQDRIVILYHPDSAPELNRRDPVQDIVLSVEPSHKMRFRWKLLIPVSVAADIATFPIQLIIFVAWGVGYIKGK